MQTSQPNITFFFFFFLVFLGLHLQNMEIPYTVKSELQLMAYTIAHSNARILHPLSGARNWTHILMDAS